MKYIHPNLVSICLTGLADGLLVPIVIGGQLHPSVINHKDIDRKGKDQIGAKDYKKIASFMGNQSELCLISISSEEE